MTQKKLGKNLAPLVYEAGTALRLGHPVQGKKHVTTHRRQGSQRLMQGSLCRRHVTVQTGACCVQSLPGFTGKFCKMYVVILLRLFLFFFFHKAANIILLMVLSLLRRLRRFVVSQSIAVFSSPPFWGSHLLLGCHPFRLIKQCRCFLV